MLINFRFKNCRSFYEEANLSLEAVRNDELQEINTFFVNENLMNKNENELLKSAVIFGANASGKSNVLKALYYMRRVLLMSASQFPIVKSNEAFAFYNNAVFESSLYEVEIIQNNKYYKYGFELLNGQINKEWLERRIERLTPIFKREGNVLEINGLSNQASRLINVAPYTLFLSVGNNFNLDIAEDLKDVMTWFQNLIIVFEDQANNLDIYTLEQEKYKEQALKILKLADIGIKGMQVRKDKIANFDDFFNNTIKNRMPMNNNTVQGQIAREDANLYNIDMETKFAVYNQDKTYVEDKIVKLFQDAGFNSEGTTRLLCYLGWILLALDKGKVIFIDEIDSRLHFLVADYILRLFNSIDKNPHNAQLVCTAHNVMLMDEDLRRDQIYFTSKDEYGESRLVALSDYKNVRKTDLFSKKYLAGFYADLPDMSDED